MCRCALKSVKIIIPNRGSVIMSQQNNSRGERKEERRKHWQDRRVSPDRRNSQRLQRADYDCRSGVPRRQSDVGGELADGEIWWQQEINYF